MGINRWVGIISMVLLVGTFGLDLLTPQNLVLAILYNIPIALSTLVFSRRLTLGITAMALLANLLAGFFNAGLARSFDPVALGNRVLAALSFFLIALLSLQTARASAQAVEAKTEEEKIRLERLLRRIVEELSSSFTPELLLGHTCKLFQVLLQADGVAVMGDKPLYQWPLDWAIPPDLPSTKSITKTLWSGRSHLLAPLKPQMMLVIQNPRLTRVELVVEEIMPTLQALLGKAELFERTQLQQSEISQRNRVIGDLVYAFSHDVRTPLMANVLNMKLALEGAYGELPEAYLQTLRNGLESNEEMVKLAESLMLIARLESGPIEVPSARLDLALIIHEAMERLGNLYQERGIRLEYNGLQHLEILGREGELKRLMKNLLDNAAKFAPQGTVVWVSLGSKDQKAIIEVADQGKGVSKEVQKHLFLRFSGSREGGGSGLGLYLCKQIALAHGGDIRYQENPGGGSLFQVELPL